MLLVVDGDVVEGLQLEVRAVLAIQPRQQVQVEFRGDAGRVVIGGLDDIPGLLEVHADQ